MQTSSDVAEPQMAPVSESAGVADACGGVGSQDGGHPCDAGLEVPEWDVAMGPRKEGAQRWGMFLPTMLRLATNIVGGTGAAVGYTIGKCGEIVGCGKAIDSPAFQAGFTGWMWSNGIFPEVEYEPLGDAVSSRLMNELGASSPPSAEDMSLTPLVVSNHVSSLDGLILAATFGAPRVVAMAKCRRIPVLGGLMEQMDTVFVDPRDADSRQKTADAILGHCAGWQSGQRPLLVFPEGTMTNGQGLVDFKKGAFLAGVPVRPVVLVYTGHFDPASTSYKMTKDGPRKVGPLEWGRQFYGHYIHSVHVRVLPPYFPSEEEQTQPDLYARRCQAYVAEELARVRQDLHQRSWKHAAGREDGGLAYQLGDETRAASRMLWSFFD